jgi:hypothetical protein
MIIQIYSVIYIKKIGDTLKLFFHSEIFLLREILNLPSNAKILDVGSGPCVLQTKIVQLKQTDV